MDSYLVWHTCAHGVGVVFHLISFQTWRRGGAEGGGVAGVLAEIGLPLPIIANISPADRQAGRRKPHGEGGGGGVVC